MKAKIAKATALLVALYAIAGVVVQATASLPPAELTPRAGDKLVSHAERVEQTVLRDDGEMVFNELVLLPGSEGPPPHHHVSFDEAFTVMEGTLSVEVDGVVRTLGAGEKERFVAGSTHRPFNASTERVVVHGAIPKVFVTCLSQFYAFMDAKPENARGITPLLQLSLMRGYCDTHIGPAPVEALLFGAFGPMAKLSGLRSWYPPAPSPR